MSKNENKKQIGYRDARITGEYDGIWQTVGKCVFCDMREKYIVHEENGVVLTVPLYAYIDGHLNIIPQRHIRSAKELTSKEWETVRKLSYLSKKMIREIHGIKGIQFIQKEGADAQSTVEHLHFHVVPFDAPDLSTWNYRKLKNTPLENADLYKEKSDKFKKLSKRYDKKYE